MNRTVLNRTLLNTSVLCQSRLNQSGLASLCGKAGGIPAAIRQAMVLWYDIARQGCSNETMQENPVLRDLSGNGHDAICYNFGWSGMSGVGGYNFQNLDAWIPNTGIEVNVINHNKVSLTNSMGTLGIRAGFLKDTTFKLRVSDIDSTIPVYIYRMRGGGNENELLQTITENGDYAVELVHNPDDVCNMIVLTGRAIFEQLPNYPGALVSDGVDDYAYVEGLPILTKEEGYTVIVKRRHLNFAQNNTYALVSKCSVPQGDDGAFMFEARSSPISVVIRSFGSRAEFSNSNLPDISWMTSQSYDGNPIIVGDASDYDKMVLFRHNTTDNNFYGQFALYSLLLFSRDLTAEEIEWVKTNLITA